MDVRFCIFVRLLTAALLWQATVGCQSAAKQRLSAIAAYDQGIPDQCVERLEQARESRGAEENIIAIDTALAKLMAGDTRACESTLRQSREQLNFLSQKDLAEQTASVLRDDKAVAWSGREFELRMVDSLLVLSSLLGDRQDAFAYATQVMDHVSSDRRSLNESPADSSIVTVGHSDTHQPPPPPRRLSVNAFAAWLHAAVHSEVAMNADVADRSVASAGYWNGSSENHMNLTALGTRTRRDHGGVNVVTFVGRVTDWTAERAEPTSASLLVADRILSAVGDHTLPPTIAPVSIGRPSKRHSSIPLTTAARLDGLTSGFVMGRALLDLNAIAWDSYSHDRDDQIARAVVRRIVKKGAVYAAKDSLAIQKDSAADLLLNAGGVVWEAIEKPDTRHLSLLPERIEVLQLEVPAGKHSLTLTSALNADAASESKQTLTIPIHIDNGRNTFVLCYRTAAGLSRVVTADGVYRFG